MTGCGAVGSALRSGRRGRRFESCHPDRGCETEKFPDYVLFTNLMIYTY